MVLQSRVGLCRGMASGLAARVADHRSRDLPRHWRRDGISAVTVPRPARTSYHYFGVDFDIVENRASFLSRFACERCGRRLATCAWCWRPDTLGLDSGTDHRQPLSVAEATRRFH